MRYLRYIFEWLSYLASEFIFRVSILLAKMPFGTQFFRTLVAARALGEGSRAIKRKKYDHAYRVLKVVENYDIDDVWVGGAQFQLGILYFYGHGVAKNEDKAIQIFQRAARAGDSDAIDYMKRLATHQRAGYSNYSLQPTAFRGG